MRYHGGGAGVNTNGQYHGHWIGEAGQIHACAYRAESEIGVAERHNPNLQAHSVDDPIKRKCSRKRLMEGARRNHYREGADLQAHVFLEGCNPFAVRTQAEVLLQIEAILPNLELREGREERHKRRNRD